MKKTLKIFLAFVITLISGAVICSGSFSATAASENEKWICAWGTAPTKIALEGFSNISAFVGDVTVRSVITPTASGSKLRLRVSNYYGEEPLKINYVTVAKSTGDSKIDVNSLKYVTFEEGYPGVTIPAGKEYYSDPITFDVNAHEDIAITIYVSEYQDVSTMGLSGADTYITMGDAGRKEDFDLLKEVIDDQEMLDILAGLLEGFGMGNSINLKLAYSFIKVVPCIASLDVLSEDSGYSVVVVGDSTVANEVPLYIAKSIYEDDNIENVGVVGKGIIGNSLLRSGLGMGSYLFGESMISRLERDVLSQSGVKYVVVKIGANDIIHPVCVDNMENYPGIKQPTAQELIEGYRTVFKKCHDAGVKVIAASITQWKGTTRDYFGNGGTYIRTAEEFEADWQIAKDVNEWLANTKEHDGYVDLCEISENPLDPDSFLPEYSEDRIHPTDTLQKVWGNYFPHSLLGIGSMPGGVLMGKTDVDVYVGQTKTIEATVYPESAENKQLEWFSENPAVATVDENGVVMGHSNGTAVIGCKTAVGGYKATCRVKVTTKVDNIFLNYNQNKIYTTQTFTLKASIFPETATDKGVTWSSSNKKVAKVDSKGNVTGVGAGTAIITCRSNDGLVSQTCSITVVKKTPVQNVVLQYGSNDNIKSKTLYKGKSFVLEPVISPENATFKAVKWSSSAPKIASVDSEGRVTAVAAGQAIIKCTSEDNPMVTASCTVTVKVKASGVSLSLSSFKLYETKTKALTAKVLPSDATNKNVVWTSENEKVAEVNSKGVVTAISDGVTYIVVTTKDGSFKAKCKVTVMPVIDTTKVKLNKTTLNLNDGKTYNLKATVYPADATYKAVTWSTSNKKVVTVTSKGKITAVNPGTAYIYCKTKDTGKTAKCKVTVKKVSPVSVSFASLSINVDCGDIVKLKATVLPSNTTDKSLTWSSSDPSVVKVSQAGNVKGLKAGKSAVITVTTKDGKKKDKITVYVKAVAAKKITLSRTSVTINKGKTLQLSANFSPANTTNKTLTWTSSNKKVATVSSTGKITAVGKGTAVITCKTKNGKTATCKVTVNTVAAYGIKLDKTSVMAQKGADFTIKATVLPTNATNTKVKWTSSDTSVAKVSSSGKVTAVGVGYCEIKAVSVDGGYSASCAVSVFQ